MPWTRGFGAGGTGGVGGQRFGGGAAAGAPAGGAGCHALCVGGAAGAPAGGAGGPLAAGDCHALCGGAAGAPAAGAGCHALCGGAAGAPAGGAGGPPGGHTSGGGAAGALAVGDVGPPSAAIIEWARATNKAWIDPSAEISVFSGRSRSSAATFVPSRVRVLRRALRRQPRGRAAAARNKLCKAVGKISK